MMFCIPVRCFGYTCNIKSKWYILFWWNRNTCSFFDKWVSYNNTPVQESSDWLFWNVWLTDYDCIFVIIRYKTAILVHHNQLVKILEQSIECHSKWGNSSDSRLKFQLLYTQEADIWIQFNGQTNRA